MRGMESDSTHQLPRPLRYDTRQMRALLLLSLTLHAKTGQIVVTIENPDGLLLVDPQQKKVIRKFDVQGRSPHMVLFGPEGKRAYVSNTNSGTVASIEVATGKTTLIPTGKYPQGGVLS